MDSILNSSNESRIVKWLSEKSVSAITGLSVSTLQKHRHKHTGIPYTKVGRAVRYAYADVMAFMEAHKINLRA